jgi:hypothetical protein
VGELIDKAVTVTDQDGRSVTAQLKTCSDCGGREWFFYMIPVGPEAKLHGHMQCVECDATYCDQACQANAASSRSLEATS